MVVTKATYNMVLQKEGRLSLKVVFYRERGLYVTIRLFIGCGLMMMRRVLLVLC